MSQVAPFWWVLTWTCVAWYAGLTLYVAWKGVRDIRRMLRELQARHGKGPL